jgi:hypothetical protein
LHRRCGGALARCASCVAVLHGIDEESEEGGGAVVRVHP